MIVLNSILVFIYSVKIAYCVSGTGYTLLVTISHGFTPCGVYHLVLIRQE